MLEFFKLPYELGVLKSQVSEKIVEIIGEIEKWVEVLENYYKI